VVQDSISISISSKLVLITNRKSHKSFQLVPKSVTLNGKMAAPRWPLPAFVLSLAMIVGEIISKCAFYYATT